MPLDFENALEGISLDYESGPGGHFEEENMPLILKMP